MCAGIESITENIGGQNKQYFFLCQKGAAMNSVNGIAPQYTVSGRRIYGDEAQEYVCGLKYKFGRHRKTTFRMEREWIAVGGDNMLTVIEGPCTILDVSDIGGNTTDNVPFSFVFALDAKPDVFNIILPNG